MRYCQLGRTGLKVSRLGFGAMRLPMVGSGPAAKVNRDLAVPMIRRAFDLGVNYIDTAVMYCNDDSQRAVGAALKGYRDRIILSTKNHYFDNDEKAWWQNLENSLQRLEVNYLDIYHHHGINWKTYTQQIEPRVGKWMRQALDQKLIRHIACSFHDDNQALHNLIDTGYPQVITLQYNLLDRQLEDGIAYAQEKGIGVVVMGPVGGGRLGVDSQVFNNLLPSVRRVPELALRFVLSNPHVAIALSGMNEMRMVEENAAIAADVTPLSAADRAAIAEHLTRLKNMADLYCTGCAYCKPCPQEVDIPAVFSLYNTGRVYGFWDQARQRYKNLLAKNNAADKCAACGECEGKCPQHLAIRSQLEEAHKVLMVST